MGAVRQWHLHRPVFAGCVPTALVPIQRLPAESPLQTLLVPGGNPGDDRVDAYEHPDRFQKQEAPLAVDPGGADEDDRADQVRDEVPQRGRWSDLEVQQRESPHVEGGSDQLDDDYRPHGWRVLPARSS